MLEVIRQFFDKKSPIFIITISLAIATIVALGYEIDMSFISAGGLRKFYISVLVAAVAELVFKTCGMEIFKRTCSAAIGKIHIIVITVFLLLNGGLYAWSIALNLDFKGNAPSALNEPHQFLLEVYFLVMSTVYIAVLVLLVSLKLENKTMTVLEQEKQGDNNELSF